MIRHGILSALAGLFLIATAMVSPVQAAPYAAMVVDARNGEVLHSRNADTRLHPASLTKMMTLYLAFEALRLGEITLDTEVLISANAAAEPPSELGLRAGSTIRFRYLIRAAAIRSANDAATAIGEAISGSEAAFARRMNRTAEALGMSRTTFRNANGLTEEGHLSTARDMTTLGRHLIYSYPQYYNIFSRLTEDAGIATVRNTNRVILTTYRGADGIKTGYTRAAGFNLVASAQRGEERIIATVFGGTSSAARNERIAELLDMGFERAPSSVALRVPGLPTYDGLPMPSNEPAARSGQTLAVSRSIRPMARPLPTPEPELVAAISEAVGQALTTIVEPVEAAPVPASALPVPRPEPEASIVVATDPSPPAERGSDMDMETAPIELAAAILGPESSSGALTTDPADEIAAALTPAPEAPAARILVAASPATRPTPPEPEVITRASTSGNRLFGVSLGLQPSQGAAERLLLQTALSESATLSTALRRVVTGGGGYDARFAGLTEDQASTACARLSARAIPCETFGP